MKTALVTIALVCSLAVSAQVQDEQERLQQQPPVVTERQVQTDAKKAAEVRSDNDKLPDNEKQLKAQQAEDMRANKKDARRAANTTAEAQPATTKSTKKTSTKPEKQ